MCHMVPRCGIQAASLPYPWQSSAKSAQPRHNLQPYVILPHSLIGSIRNQGYFVLFRKISGKHMLAQIGGFLRLSSCGNLTTDNQNVERLTLEHHMRVWIITSQAALSLAAKSTLIEEIKDVRNEEEVLEATRRRDAAMKKLAPRYYVLLNIAVPRSPRPRAQSPSPFVLSLVCEIAVPCAHGVDASVTRVAVRDRVLNPRWTSTSTTLDREAALTAHPPPLLNSIITLIFSQNLRGLQRGMPSTDPPPAMRSVSDPLPLPSSFPINTDPPMGMHRGSINSLTACRYWGCRLGIGEGFASVAGAGAAGEAEVKMCARQSDKDGFVDVTDNEMSVGVSQTESLGMGVAPFSLGCGNIICCLLYWCLQYTEMDIDLLIAQCIANAGQRIEVEDVKEIWGKEMGRDES
ncbi:hypothetical protein C8F04DRAFT_1198127 [Mycena alexandri]|uniref:Uncharacterized protein n=1 Tax=Mycena alexandri TaxID=1745969 RepID=A0AAD6WS79_9AGAR|nr:hypothetical protein C8F04DRAFT_1198127 [Mycena alexandri]